MSIDFFKINTIIKTMQRASFEEMAILIAISASYKSEELYTRVGAVGFNKGNEIVGVAYNGFKSGMKLTEKFLKNREEKNKFVIHAESNLLSRSKKGEIKTIFLTHSPCKNCATNICANGVEEVVYLQEYHKEQEFKEIFDFYGIKYRQVSKKEISNIIEFAIDIKNNLKLKI